MVIHKILKRFRVNGETPPPAPDKVATNAVALLERFGYSKDELAELSAADEAKVGVLFTARHSALESDVIARKGAEIKKQGNFEGIKHAYKEAEKRVIERANSLGIEITEAELSAFEEKERLEGITDLLHGKLKATANPNAGENEKELQRKLESFQQSDAQRAKELKAALKELAETKDSIPKVREQIQAEYFAEQAWKGIALNPKTLETLSINDADALTSMVLGRMSMRGHRFAAEKGTDGFRLQVVDKEGNYVQMTGAAGNHSPESYINEIYAPLVRKSNAGMGGNGQFEMPAGGEGQKISTVGNDAVQKMIEQAKAAQQ